MRGIAKMESYLGKVCRASNRNAFDESSVSPYISQEPAGLSALFIDLLIPREVIRDVNTKILLSTDNFKLRAGQMIDKDDGFKFPSDALRFAGPTRSVSGSTLSLIPYLQKMPPYIRGVCV